MTSMFTIETKNAPIGSMIGTDLVITLDAIGSGVLPRGLNS